MTEWDFHHATEARCYDARAEEKLQRALDHPGVLRVGARPSFCEIHDDLFRGLERVLPSFTGKHIVEIGSGDGELATWFAAHCGGNILSCDISEKNIAIAMLRRAQYPELHERLHFVHMPFEQLDAAHNMWDVIYGNVVLHHLKMEEAIQKLLQLLHPDGIAAFIEPFAFSERLQALRASRLGRWFFPVRQETPTERILTPHDIQRLRASFDVQLIPYRWFFPLYHHLRQRCSKQPYRQTELRLVHACDRGMLRIFPPLKAFARYAIITLRCQSHHYA